MHDGSIPPQLHKCVLSRGFAERRRIPPNIANATDGVIREFANGWTGGADPPSAANGASDEPSHVRSD
jgi:hypothetical protein